MEYVDTPFPERIAFQSRAETMWNTELVALLSGYESTNQNWSQTRHAYDAGLAVRVASDYLLVKAHFHAMRGRAKSFPFTDPIDHTVVQAAGILQAEQGSPNDLQMVYRYGNGSEAYDRRITRPKNGTIAIFRTRGGVTTNVTGGGTTISYTTGIVAVGGHVAGDTYAWSGDFYVPCRYDIDRLPGVIVNKEPSADGQLYVECESIPILEVRE
jgi:uncharacterized protein (TIGR02217 family)